MQAKTTIKVKGTIKKIRKGLAQKWILFEFKSQENQLFVVYARISSDDFLQVGYLYEMELSGPNKYNNYILEGYNMIEATKEDLKVMLKNHIRGFKEEDHNILKENLGENYLDVIKDTPKEERKIFYEFIKPPLLKKIEAFIEEVLNMGKDERFFITNNIYNFYIKLKQKLPLADGESYLDFFDKNKENHEDPYLILYIELGLSFDSVDNFASLIGYSKDCETRYYAIVYKSIYDFGIQVNDTYYNLSDLHKNWLEFTNELILNNKLSISKLAIDNVFINSINKLIEMQKLYYAEKEVPTIALSFIKEQEDFIFEKLITIKNKINKTIPQIEDDTLTAKQLDALNIALNEPISIISGFPGTGKTYLISNIYESLIAQKVYKKGEIEILTPTGRAAINIKNKSNNLPAKTIHNYLKIDKEDEDVVYNNDCDKTKVVIIDEFSMVNLKIFYQLLSHLSKLEKLIIVGDKDQLPCIGPGNLMHDLCNWDFIPKTLLIENQRAESDEICEHFLSIIDSKVKEVEIGSTNTIQMKEINSVALLNELSYLYQTYNPEYNSEKMVTLIPLHDGQVGAKTVNKWLQKEKLNNYTYKLPKFKQSKDNYIQSWEGTKFYLFDNVIQLINDYEKNVFNGEIGIIKEIIDDKIVSVEYPQGGNKFKTVNYVKSEIAINLSLAYALTVHKFQGSEAPHVVIPVFKDYSRMLNKKLLYTAVSRAKEKLFILGDLALYAKKTKTEDYSKIKTYLFDLIKEQN
ncbi:ATP-dependent DNA helicase [Mycoplasmopsis fermentans]|uniref:ATP-dependent DNA helicase n=1 Tax=Mycoplasmopsis fermentans TaxID=2115 RepID=UPI0001E330B3|nr:AAA family ATPase [Mycoplasmopsis fermentans]ADN69430.1 exodeoxyribonuclease V [Mycoplasmopsis fermentans JER]